MKINKKLLIAIIALMIVVGLMFIPSMLRPAKKIGSKNIEIIVVDEMSDKEIYNKTINTDTLVLSELLKEVKDLKVVLEESTYGSFITSILDLKQGGDAGPWWLYESENNEMCKAEGFCPASDALNISDGDKFTFKYTDKY